jgi:hypothetical protein
MAKRHASLSISLVHRREQGTELKVFYCMDFLDNFVSHSTHIQPDHKTWLNLDHNLYPVIINTKHNNYVFLCILQQPLSIKYIEHIHIYVKKMPKMPKT